MFSRPRVFARTPDKSGFHFVRGSLLFESLKFSGSDITGNRLAAPATTRALLCTLAMAALVCGGCRKPGDAAWEEGGQPVTRTASQGPVDLSLTARTAELSADQLLHLRIETTADQGVTIYESDYARTLAQGDLKFEARVIDSRQWPPVATADGRRRWVQDIQIEFVLPGEYELPAVSVSFSIENPDDEVSAAPQTVSTEPIAILVAAGQGQQFTEAQLKELKRLDPIELPTIWRRWWWAWTALVVAVVAVLAVLLTRHRRRRREMVIVIPAHVWARDQINALLAEDLLGRGMVQEFYYRISGIVRGYIERRFAVSATDMTTEEFLKAAAEHRRLAGDHAGELGRFLLACDMVKYARYLPGAQESDAVLEAACDFVERTRQRVTDGADSDAVRVEEAA